MIMASASVNNYVPYPISSWRGVFLLMYLVSMRFSVSHLSTRQMLRVAGFVLLLYGVVIWALVLQDAGLNLRLELPQWAALAFVAVWFSIIVTCINTLMTRLGQSEFDKVTGAYTRRRLVEILRPGRRAFRV